MTRASANPKASATANADAYDVSPSDPTVNPLLKPTHNPNLAAKLMVQLQVNLQPEAP